MKLRAVNVNGKKHAVRVSTRFLDHMPVKGLKKLPKNYSNIEVRVDRSARYRLGLEKKEFHRLGDLLPAIDWYQSHYETGSLLNYSELDSEFEKSVLSFARKPAVIILSLGLSMILSRSLRRSIFFHDLLLFLNDKKPGNNIKLAGFVWDTFKA
jgi:hypothetical protein